MGIRKIQSFLLDRGMVYLYALFVAGYFLLPMAAGHRNLYYALVLPAALLLWRELWGFYRGNALFALLLTYVAWMLGTLAWTADFNPRGALATIWYAVALLSFIGLSGFLWIQYPRRLDQLAHRATWLAAAAAVVSIVAWYWQNPFPGSRLEPLGVMHHQNKGACAYGIFLVLCVHYLFSERGRDNKLLYATLAGILLSLVVFTQSRTALGAVAVGLLVLVGYRALAVVAVGAVVSLLLVASDAQDWIYRVETLSFRPGIWRQVISDMSGHWGIGHGYLLDPHVSAYDQVFNHAHNGYLATLRDGGLIGLGLLLALLAVAGLWALRLYRERGERLYLALLLYGMTAITMDFDRLLVHPKELWLFFWLPVALIMAVYPHRDDPGLIRYPVSSR